MHRFYYFPFKEVKYSVYLSISLHKFAMGGDGKGDNFCAWVVCVAQKPCRLQGKIKVSIEIMGFQILCHFQTLYFIFNHRSER